MPLTRQKTWTFLKAFFSTPIPARRLTARTLSKLLLTSLKLYPVALTAQMGGIACLFGINYHSSGANAFLWSWTAAGIVNLYLSLSFVRGFWKDTAKAERVRTWVRRWFALAVYSGIVWGVAAGAFTSLAQGLWQIVTVAAIVAVTFASWPVYSCWLPSLTAFTLLSLTPLTIAIAAQYSISQTVMSLVLFSCTLFILYSGRRLNEMIVSSILTDEENVRLVQRLKIEVARSERARRATQAESERRSRFFAAANHDLRQPLQALGIFLEILRKKAAPDTKMLIEQLCTTSKSISTLVEQVLEVTRMEFGRVEVHPEEIDVAQMLEEIEAEFRPIAEEKGLKFRVTSIPVSVKTDRLMLMRALKNLISNAVRYTTRPGAEIVIGARRFGRDKVRIGVYDAGPGMTNEEKSKIFETFYRGEGGKAQPGTGFGLGLSIVKGLCSQLGIDVSVGTRLGRGSVFRLSLPISEAEQIRLTEKRSTGRRSYARINEAVALLEDNFYVREAVASLLSEWTDEVLTSSSPSNGFIERILEAESKSRGVILVTDYNLGDGEPTGLEFCGMLEKARGGPASAVIVTAVARDLIESEWRKLKEEGRAPEALPLILQKPVDNEQLNRALKQIDKELEKIRSAEKLQTIKTKVRGFIKKPEGKGR